MKKDEKQEKSLDMITAEEILKHLKSDESKYKANKFYVASRKQMNRLGADIRLQWNKRELNYKMRHAKNVYFSGMSINNDKSTWEDVVISFGNPKAKPYFAFTVFSKKNVDHSVEHSWKNDELYQAVPEDVIIGDDYLSPEGLMKACKLWYEQQVIDFIDKRNWSPNFFFNFSFAE